MKKPVNDALKKAAEWRQVAAGRREIGRNRLAKAYENMASVHGRTHCAKNKARTCENIFSRLRTRLHWRARSAALPLAVEGMRIAGAPIRIFSAAHICA
jgi:hypothetical protein